MFGAIAGGSLQDRCGRRLSLALGSITSSVGVALVFVSCDTGASKQGVFFAGKFVQGLTIGVVVTVTQTYMSEVVSAPVFSKLLLGCIGCLKALTMQLK